VLSFPDLKPKSLSVPPVVEKALLIETDVLIADASTVIVEVPLPPRTSEPGAAARITVLPFLLTLKETTPPVSDISRCVSSESERVRVFVV